jgi:hypothetical protein
MLFDEVSGCRRGGQLKLRNLLSRQEGSPVLPLCTLMLPKVNDAE